MTRVGIAQLKAHLSEHLRAVEAGGTVEVLDRDRPIAHLVPVPAPVTLAVVRKAACPLDLAALPPLTVPLGPTDSLRWLLDDRETDRRR